MKEKSENPIITLDRKNGKCGGKAVFFENKITGLGKCGGKTEGTVSFGKLDLPHDGYYTLRFSYFSGADDRYFNITADGESYKLACPSTGGFDCLGETEIDIFLSAGCELTVGSDWYAPDLEKIEVFIPGADEYVPKVYDNRCETSFAYGDIELVCDTHNGIWSLNIHGKTVISDAHAEADLCGTAVSSEDFTEHRAEQDGDTVRFIHSGHSVFGGVMTQIFKLGENVFTEVLLSESDVCTNRIAPIAVHKGGIGEWKSGVFAAIPFDNDKWVEPSLVSFRKLGKKQVSYEAAAVFERDSGNGLVVGSVEHDVWKTGIEVQAYHGEVREFSVFAGIADDGTRDNSPHGTVSGAEVRSPKIFMGYFDDWRDGFKAYADANAEIAEPKPSVPDVPFGYNSWGVLQDKVKYSDMIAVSDYIKTYLQDVWKQDNAPVYVNIDSFWDFLVHNDPSCSLPLEDALRAFVSHCHENGQKAGIYFTPFTAWHGSEESLRKSRMEGSDYTYYDAAVKKSDGSGLYGKLDGGYALDPTHPAVLIRTEQKLKWFIDLGFEYVKLDFMTHGAVEGKHYDPEITTGMQAYSAGMARIREICDGKMFVNLSIAPLFSYQYTDGRRISCDAFSSIDNTKHVLSYLTACFWEDRLYPYPDPDHLVVWGKDGNVSEGEARCRVTAGAICGTSFLVGDSLSDVPENTEKHERLVKMFANAGIVSAAKLGCMFTPYEIMPDCRCADSYILEKDGEVYLAVFNFEKHECSVRYDLKGLPKTDAVYTAEELWRGDKISLDGGVLAYRIPNEDAALFRITLCV